MASDFSNILKEAISATLEATLGKNAPISSVNLCTTTYLHSKQIVTIQSDFKFDKIDSNIKFIYPARTASYVFNAMLGESGLVEVQIDEDTADALKEITAQISGSLTTSINASEFEDLGKVTYTSGESLIDIGENYKTEDDLILLNILLDDITLEIILHLSEQTIPFVDELINSPQLQDSIEDINGIDLEENNEDIDGIDLEENNEDKFLEENEQLQENENNESHTNEDILEDESSDTNQDDVVPTDENIQVQEEVIKNNAKENKLLKLLVIIAASLLSIVTIVFLFLFFSGSFDEKKDIKSDQNISEKDELLINIKNKKISYTPDMINVQKLNKRLSLLSKYEILDTNDLEKYKNNEKERLYKLKISNLNNFAKKNKEESLFTNNELNNSVNQQKEKLTFIQIDAIKYKKYKQIVNVQKHETTNISICAYKNEQTKVLIGPMNLQYVIDNIMNNINNNDAKLLYITQDDFNKQCDF